MWDCIPWERLHAKAGQVCEGEAPFLVPLCHSRKGGGVLGIKVNLGRRVRLRRDVINFVLVSHYPTLILIYGKLS